MSEAVFIQAVEKHVQAVRLCIDNKLFMPALVLIYSGIDFLSALTRPAGKQETDRCVVINWVDRYMPCERLGIYGVDLYGARCGVLHAMTSESRLQRQAKAKRVFYTWGGAEPQPLNDKLRGNPGVFVKIETLFDGFVEGVGAFGTAINSDKSLLNAVVTRTGEIFAEYETFAPHSATQSQQA